VTAAPPSLGTLLPRLLARALPGRRVVRAEPLAGGLSNASWRVRLDPALDVVLRIYARDPAACRKEVALHALVRDVVPVPEIVHAEPDGAEGVGPFAVLRWVEGITFRELKRAGDRAAIAEAAASAGAALAALGRVSFARGGWLEGGPDGLTIGAPLLDGADAAPRFVDQCLASPHLARRVPNDLRERVHRLVWAWAPRLLSLERERRLVHGDFRKQNVLVAPGAGGWRVAAVIDWEFAVAGAPLADVANFLRYERDGTALAEPHFSRAFVAHGGALPDDWAALSRVLDLVALGEMLSRERMPGDVAAEIVGLVRGTVDAVPAAQ
jgi:aminoglycoside phosphotransferase (APT) family kinase protein